MYEKASEVIRAPYVVLWLTVRIHIMWAHRILTLACKTCESIFLRPLKIIFELISCKSASLLEHN